MDAVIRDFLLNRASQIELLAEDIVAVQPMVMPQGLIFALRNYELVVYQDYEEREE